MATQPVVQYTDMLPYVVNDLPGCPQPVIVQSLQQAGRKFCVDTEALREELTIDVVEDQTEYDLRPTQMTLVHRIFNVEYDGTDLKEDKYVLQEGDTLVLEDAPTEDITGGLVVTIVRRPMITSMILPVWFMERWSEAIMAGARAELMFQPMKPWSNPELGTYWDRQYKIGVAQAVREKFTEFKQADTAVKMRNFI